MPSEEQTARELESVDWERVQEIVRAFRRAVEGDERPALEAFLPEANGNRRAALIELIHEEMEFQIKAAEPYGVAAYLECFPRSPMTRERSVSWPRPSRRCGGGWCPSCRKARTIL